MKLKDVFKLEEAFNPSIYYDGRLSIGNAVYRNEKDELYLNAKQTKKSNAYKEFIDKYYYEPLAKIVGKDSHDLEYSAALDTIYDKVSDQKVTAFSLKTFLAIKIADIQIPCVNYDAFSYACDNLEDDEQILDLERVCIIHLIIMT